MDPMPIPLCFAQDRLCLSWADIHWGFQRGWCSAGSVVEYAVAHLSEHGDGSPAVVELAGLTSSELAIVPLLLEEIVGLDSIDLAEVRRRWLFLVLSWIYDHRTSWADPLGMVEQIYADFDYPQDIRGFVRYMPSDGTYESQAYTSEENVVRLVKKWREYLDSFALDLGCPEKLEGR